MRVSLRAHCAVSLETALTADAFSWLALLIMWVGFLRPFGASATGRGIAVALVTFAFVKLFAAARFNSAVRDVAITFVVSRAAIIVIAELAAVVVAQRPGAHVAVSSIPILAVWGRWDAVHYIDIASAGYYGTDMAFFPLYPLLISLLGKLTGSHLIAGLVISNAALFVGLIFFYKLVEHQYNRHVAHRAVFYISIFPTAIFFSAVYTESLFLALTVASFYFIREHKWLIAGIIGFFAALTRVEGVLLVVPMAIEWLRSPGARQALQYPLERLMRPLIGMALIPLGLMSYMGYLWILTGDPLYFSHVQINWHRHLAPPWVSLSNSFYLLVHAHNGNMVANQFLELIVHAPHDRNLDRCVPPALADVLELYGALDPGPDVDVEPDEHAAVRAGSLPDVRADGAMGIAAVRQQRNRCVLASALGTLHGSVRRLVLGCLSRRPLRRH